MDMRPRPDTPPFWESTPFWGFASIVAALVLTVLGVRLKNLSWLFVTAWVCSIPASFIFCRSIQNRWLRYLSTSGVLLVLAGVLYWLNKDTAPIEEPKAVAVAIDWNPKPISWNAPLSADQLNATASVAGKKIAGDFVYNPTYGASIAAEGNTTLYVKFTPTDTVAYKQAEKTVVLVVKPAPPKPSPPTQRPIAPPPILPSKEPPRFKVSNLRIVAVSDKRSAVSFSLQNVGETASKGFSFQFAILDAASALDPALAFCKSTAATVEVRDSLTIEPYYMDGLGYIGPQFIRIRINHRNINDPGRLVAEDPIFYLWGGSSRPNAFKVLDQVNQERIAKYFEKWEPKPCE
jgi:hypothetical protein